MRLEGVARQRQAEAMSQIPQPAADLIRRLAPNWFASVMGTGIVANAAVLLPHQVAGQRAFATAIWLLASAMLVLLLAAAALQWRLAPGAARRHALDPKMAPFFGAPPMALLTVGAGTLLLGGDVIGSGAAVAVDLVLWTLGTLTGLLASAAIPYLMFTRHSLRPEATFASWLMPVVPPMVSAATGAALVAHLPAGQAQLTMLLACYAMFGLSLIASLVTITLVWARLAYHDVGPSRMVPTLWIVLGPLGQSVTAANLLGGSAPGAIPAPYSTAMEAMGVLYGAPVWGFAMLWMAIAAAITVRALRGGMRFSLTWWSFTFPVGTCVTGTSALAVRTGSVALSWIAVGLYGLLLAAWAVAAANTAHRVPAGRSSGRAPAGAQLARATH